MSRNNQKGSVLIIAIFVIVVMGMLGLTLMRLEASNQDTLTREILGTQAWFLAHSGNEWGLTYMYPLNQSAAVSNLQSQCSTLNTSAAANAAAAIIENSQAPCSSLTIQCDEVGSGDLTFFRISSVAVCGSTTFEVSREQEVWAKSME